MYNAYGHKKVKILYSSVVDITKSDGPGVNERELIFFIKDNKDLDATFLINEKNRNEFNDDSKILYLSYYYNVLSILWYQLKYVFKLSVTIVKLNPEIVILRLPPIPIWFDYSSSSIGNANFILRRKEQLEVDRTRENELPIIH